MGSAVGTIEELSVPGNVESISIIVGAPCSQDGDPKRSIIVSEDGEFFGSGDTFFEKETKDLNDSEENSLVAQLVSALEKQGLTEINRQNCDEFAGFLVCLQRG